jgi:hypothetical protein
MVDHPAPGERPDIIPAETQVGPIPNGDVPFDPRRTVEFHPITVRDTTEWDRREEPRPIRQTGSERDDLRLAYWNPRALEARSDHAALEHEKVFDPAQDDSGPHSDQA